MPNREAVTMALSRRALAYRVDTLPPAVRTLARQCILDWFSVTIAALGDPVHLALSNDTDAPSGGNARIVGHAGRYPAAHAALVNGATAHALDFDDVNLAISGHPTAVIFPAVLALAEQKGSAGADVVAAFVAGYETACRIGRLVCPDHLNRGFHATGTVSGFGAAAACAHLLKFDAAQTAAALGIAGTQAAGLKAMFGTMVKPLHAGLAARRGVEAALWVARGVDSRPDILECAMGFASTHSTDFNVDQALEHEPDYFHIRNTLFKYDASCYGTHAAIECVRQIKARHGLRAEDVEAVWVRADRSSDSICNIQSPSTGMQGKFSLRLNVAFALLDVDTGKIESYTDGAVNADDAVALRDKVVVELVDGWPSMQAEVHIQTKRAERYSCVYDAGVASSDLADQERRLTAKFERLVEPVLGAPRCAALLAQIQQVEHLPNMHGLLDHCVA